MKKKDKEKRRQKMIVRLEKIAQLNEDRLTPKAVLDDARNPKSPLHEFFEWDDKAAAEKYRENQARELIRSVRIEIKVKEHFFAVPRYVRDPEAEHDEQGYVEVAKIRSDEDRAREALANELDRVMQALDRAKAVAAGLGLMGEIEDLEGRVEAALAKIAA